MGWFWASQPEKELQPQPSDTPERLGGIFWASPLEPSQSCPGAKSTSALSKGWLSCPVQKDTPAQGESTPPSSCPVKQNSDHTTPSRCPVDHSKLPAKLNPLNNMPALSDARAPGQQTILPTERTMSTIPKGTAGGDGNWEYPSPQQMMNAMVRKSGSTSEIPEDAVESMVGVHNFLNEGVWEEVLKWEEPYTAQSHVGPRLLRFTGRPGDISPRARAIQLLGKVWPSKFDIPPPFDRHDWTVLRAVPGHAGDWQQVRYVIDFYEAPDELDAPAFSVDVRPALDSFQSAGDRIRASVGPVWDRAMGRA